MNEIDKNLETARIFLEEKRPEWALEELDRIPKTYFEDEEIFFLRSQALFDLKQYGKAIGVIEAGLRRRPESVALLYLLCNCEAEMGNLASAELAILAALRLVPQEPGLLCRYALLVAQAGDIKKAERLVEVASRIAPEDPTVVKMRIVISYLRGDDRQMDRDVKELIAEDPEDTFSHYMLASSLQNQGRVADAARHIQIASELDSRDPETAEAARESRIATHWLLWPLRPLYRYDSASIVIWFCSIATLILLIAFGYQKAAGIFALVYFIFCLYSWFAPPLLRWWLR